MVIESCLFCKIISGKLKSEKVYEDQKTFAFKDIRPKAPIHILICPKDHIETIADLTEQNVQMIGPLFLSAKAIAKELGVLERGYRVIFNCRKEGGQEVYHIHLHLLAGGRLPGFS